MVWISSLTWCKWVLKDIICLFNFNNQDILECLVWCINKTLTNLVCHRLTGLKDLIKWTLWPFSNNNNTCNNSINILTWDSVSLVWCNQLFSQISLIIITWKKSLRININKIKMMSQKNNNLKKLNKINLKSLKRPSMMMTSQLYLELIIL
jgi:hypothetical protein